MSFLKVVKALEAQYLDDRDVQRIVTKRGVMVGRDVTKAPEDTPYFIYIEPQFERESDDQLTFETPRDSVREDRQTIQVTDVILLRGVVHTLNIRNRFLGDGRLIGVLELGRLMKRVVAKRWDLGLGHIQEQRFENTFYVSQPRHSEVQITVIFGEILYEDTREPAPFRTPLGKGEVGGLITDQGDD